ncbi:hypothetical protein Q3G72_022213 [Acer saccharum]|nr:hypothetical protein Q3G72_022213 [Acer saccharum]
MDASSSWGSLKSDSTETKGKTSSDSSEYKYLSISEGSIKETGGSKTTSNPIQITDGESGGTSAGRMLNKQVQELQTNSAIEGVVGYSEVVALEKSPGADLGAAIKELQTNSAIEGVVGYSEVAALEKSPGADLGAAIKVSSEKKNVRKWKRVARGVQSPQVGAKVLSPLHRSRFMEVAT